MNEELARSRDAFGEQTELWLAQNPNLTGQQVQRAIALTALLAALSESITELSSRVAALERANAG